MQTNAFEWLTIETLAEGQTSRAQAPPKLATKMAKMGRIGGIAMARTHRAVLVLNYDNSIHRRQLLTPVCGNARRVGEE